MGCHQWATQNRLSKRLKFNILIFWEALPFWEKEMGTVIAAAVGIALLGLLGMYVYFLTGVGLRACGWLDPAKFRDK